MAVGYMCKIAWDEEVEMASHGVTIYPSLADLQKHHPIDSCGIVEVSIKLEKIIREDNFDLI